MNLQMLKSKLKRKVYRFLGKESVSRNQLNNWLKNINVKTNRVLEIGASFNPIKDKVNDWQVKEYKTLDNNLEKDCNPDFKIDLNHLSKTNKKRLNNLHKFSPNIIFCLEVMEYIYKPFEVLSLFHEILAERGILYISFHTLYAVHEPYKYDSLRYTKYGIINLLKNAEFSKWEITPRPATKGKRDLLSFFEKEKMWALRNNDLITNTGYLIKAYK